MERLSNGALNVERMGNGQLLTTLQRTLAEALQEKKTQQTLSVLMPLNGACMLVMDTISINVSLLPSIKILVRQFPHHQTRQGILLNCFTVS